MSINIINKIGRILIVAICGAVAGLIVAGISYDKICHGEPIDDILFTLFFGGLGGLSFGIGTELVRKKGEIIKSLMRVLSCIIVCLVAFMVFKTLFPQVAFNIFMSGPLLVPMILGVSIITGLLKRWLYLKIIAGSLCSAFLTIWYSHIVYGYSLCWYYLLGGCVGVGIIVGAEISNVLYEKFKGNNKVVR